MQSTPGRVVEVRASVCDAFGRRKVVGLDRVRPLGPLVGGLLQQVALGLPLLVAGVVKGGYDLALWRWAKRMPVRPESRLPGG